MYTFFSLGLQFNWSRWKLRVQASSVPTNPINTLIHLSIFCEKSNNEQIFIPRGDPYSYLDFISFFFLSNFSSNKYVNFHYFNQYQLMGERHMCISTIIGSIIFRYPSVLRRLKSHTYIFKFYYNLNSISYSNSNFYILL